MTKDEHPTALPWWKTEGIWDGPGQHEPMAFVIRRGGGPEDVEEHYRQRFSEEYAKWIADRGYNFVEVVFFKGLGLECEREEMLRTKRFFEYLHRYGVKCGVYTQWGSLFNETFFHEVPEARNWVQLGVNGKPVEYLDRINQYFRWRGCPGNRDFLNYLKKAIDVAIQEVKADVIYFDNLCLFEHHDTLCYCECCQRGFRDHLRRKFPTPQAMFRRLGIRNADHVLPPPFRPWTEHTAVAVPLRDPMVQEFVEFRCCQLADAWNEIYRYIQSVNPSIGLMGNPSFPRKYNERLTSAIDFWLLKETPALHYMENAVRRIGIRDGALVSNIRGYKYGRVLKNVTFVPCGGSAARGLTFCEGLAFNDGSGGLGEDYEPYMAFFRQHRDEFYRGVEQTHEVAVLRHDVSLTWRWHEAFAVMELAQQELICSGLPWMPLWGQQLFDGTLDKYKVLVVPGCACLSRDEAQRIMDYVAAGGGAVILENAGTYSEYHQTLKQWRFAPLFVGAARPEGFAMAYGGNYAASFGNQKRPLLAAFGKGKALYLPQIRKTREPVRTYDEIGGYDGFQHLQLPGTWQTLPRAVEKVTASPLAFKFVGPRTATAEFLRKPDTGPLLVHVLNYAPGKVPAGTRIVMAPGAAARARIYDPDKATAGKEAKVVRGKDGRQTVTLPAFSRYALVVFEGMSK